MTPLAHDLSVLPRARERSETAEARPLRVAFVASSIPRRCGIATFTADILAAVKAADPTVRTVYAAIDEPSAARAYGPDVRWRIKQDDWRTYRDAALAINQTNVDIVNVQHEFGLYGVWHDGTYDDHLKVFLEHLKKPVVTTLHTVAPVPEPWMREALQSASEQSDVIVVMAHTAARLLKDVYGIEKEPAIIEHGMPAIEPRGRHQFKKQFGISGRQIVSTFGLVDPRKGLEYVIDAMARIVDRNPTALYLIVGQTHPELLKKEGEKYRNSLVETARAAGVADRVMFVNEYLTQRQIVDYLLATDVYVTPYLDPNQITSGTLAYALGAGKAIVSTPYLHAREVLANGRGVLVPFKDAGAIATAVNGILENPEAKRGLEVRAYDYGKEMAWPAIGRRVLALMRDILDAQPLPPERPTKKVPAPAERPPMANAPAVPTSGDKLDAVEIA
ncbi:MAG TPA: glycosyltransferase family 4 protein [Candidatus Limnocylindrales bacterium]|nr:glycosyltransferase family 4 protein [Candidatus Limnocylindrales bacterium]